MEEQQRGAFWDLTGEQLYEDYVLYRQQCNESVDDYVKEFEHQEGKLNPESVEKLKKLVSEEV
jgi:hypothetical protein